MQPPSPFDPPLPLPHPLTYLLALLQQLCGMRTRCGCSVVAQLRLLMRFVLLMLMWCNGAYDELIRLWAIDGLLSILGIVGLLSSSGGITAMIRIERSLLAAHLSFVFRCLHSSFNGSASRGGARLALGITGALCCRLQRLCPEVACKKEKKKKQKKPRRRGWLSR